MFLKIPDYSFWKSFFPAIGTFSNAFATKANSVLNRITVVCDILNHII